MRSSTTEQKVEGGQDGLSPSLTRLTCVAVVTSPCRSWASHLVLLSVINRCCVVRYDGKLSPGLKALGELPLAAWVQILGAIAVVELTIGKQDYENKVRLLLQ